MGILGQAASLLNAGFNTTATEGLNLFKFDYYSGSQITVWFGNILLDDINSIQWSRQQNKRPIYGYASQQFDDVAKGTVLIQGNFVVNFRQAGYISTLMESISSIYNTLNDKTLWPEIRKVIGVHLQNGTFGPKTSQEIQDIANDPQFLTLVKAYEDTVWGGGVPGDSQGAGPIITPISPDVLQQEEIPSGFTILVTYGNTSQNQSRTLNDYLHSTTKTLVGVHLIGDSQVIQVGGQPTLEQYDFIARGTDENLNSSRSR